MSNPARAQTLTPNDPDEFEELGDTAAATCDAWTVYGDCVVEAMPEHIYHADPVDGGSLSASGAKLLLPPSCPALFEHDRRHPSTSTTFEYGSAAHRLVLDAGPEIAVVPFDNWQTKAAKARAEEIRDAGEIPLLTKDWAKVQAMAAALRSDPVAVALLTGDAGISEASMFAADPATGVTLRARLDRLPLPHPGRMIISDYKTAWAASLPAIRKAILNCGYHQSAAWYIDMCRLLGLDDDAAFVFVFQEKDPPYLVNVVQLDDTTLRVGRERNRAAIERFRDCTETGLWPGYRADADDIPYIGLPGWAVRSHDEGDYL